MAQVITSDDLGKTKTNQPGAQGSGTQVQGGQGGASNVPTAKPAPNQQKGSGYTNIQRIVQANQGNKLGQAVGQGIQQAGQQVQGNLNQAQQQFQQQTNQNDFNTSQNQQLAQDVLNNAAQYNPQTQQGPQANQGQQFQKLISGVYQGPTQLQNASQLQGQAANVSQLGQALNTSGGRVGLLQQFVGNPQYTRGQQSLDNLLLGQANNAKELSAARQGTAGIGAKVNSAISGAQALGQQESNEAREFGNQLQTQFGQKVSDIDTQLQQKAQQAQVDRQTKYQQTIDALKSGQITQEQADLLGIGDGQQVTGDVLNNIQQYLTLNPEQATAQNVASGQDYATLNALRQLAGQSSPTAAQDVLGKYSGQDALADKFTKDQAFKADKEGFSSALQSQVNQYNSQLNPVKEGLKQAQDINRLVQERDKHRVFSPGWINAQSQINQKYPGASNGGVTRADWAQGLLNTAQQKYNSTLNSVNSAYGGLRNISITPAQAALQQASQQPNVVNTPENALLANPKVT